MQHIHSSTHEHPSARTDPGYRDSFPRAALIGAGLLVVATIAVVAFMRIDHVQPLAQVPAASATAASRDLKFEDRANGDVVVFAAGTNAPEQPIAVLHPGTNGFLRAVMRGLVYARKLQGTGPQVPFKLSELANGRLILADPTTGRRIYLKAFGHTNAEAFARLLPTAARQRHDELAVRRHD